MAFFAKAVGWAWEWTRLGLDLVFPPAALPGAKPAPIQEPFCQQCGEPFAGDFSRNFRCTNCEDREWTLAWARAAYPAEGAVRQVVHAFKYRSDFFWIGQLTDWLEEGFQRWAATESWDALVPVPLHPLRLRERGFNQAAELATELKKRIGLPSWDILERQRLTSSQARLERVGRLKNLRRAFRIKSPQWRRGFDVQGKSLLLIDDVFTTGATTEACARVLVRHGAIRVAALTIARG